jgi:hypothetical protein
MKYTLKKALIVNDHKTLQPGCVMDVTQEYAAWLDENGYGAEWAPAKANVQKEKKETKTKKNASDKEQ